MQQFSQNNVYDLKTCDNVYCILTTTHNANKYCASCLWSEVKPDAIEIKAEHFISCTSEQDALNQVKLWAESKFGTCKIVHRNG